MPYLNSNRNWKQTETLLQQAIIILWGMAEHRFNNVYNYQCLTLVLCLYLFFDKKKNRKLANIQPSLQFYDIIILVKTKPFCWGMAWIPFQKYQTYLDVIYQCFRDKGCVNCTKFFPQKNRKNLFGKDPLGFKQCNGFNGDRYIRPKPDDRIMKNHMTN